MSSSPASRRFPNVFLTLVSIIVALGIEHLLGHVVERFGESDSAHRVLVVAQGVTMFLVIGAIWISYATMVMATTWEPRFQDFYVPLAILAVLYFAILSIGSNPTAWFFLISLGWLNGGLGYRFNLPEAEEARLKPSSPYGRRASRSLLLLAAVAFASGVASWVGLLSTTAAIGVATFLAVLQLLSAWLAYQWWRAA